MSSNTIVALNYLQNYSDTSGKAHEKLKSCIWQLTKSRRNSQSGIIGVDSTTAYTAELLREELRAQICVIDGDEKSDKKISNEESVQTIIKDEGNLCTVAPKWELYDVRSHVEKSRRNAKVVNPSSPGNRNDVVTRNIGLTNRKKIEINASEVTLGTSLDTNPSSSWTIIHEEDLNKDFEDDRIVRTDPIKLFHGYFSSRELKAAQHSAQQSLISYIQAASEAAKLLEFLRDKNLSDS
mmetsp:Transcript_6326/g.15682  ORF Transcript_6326/g.15682 Transcript_6326/m.15682 type:complete len:238 (+) Transcript_6326:19-732(+)